MRIIIIIIKIKDLRAKDDRRQSPGREARALTRLYREGRVPGAVNHTQTAKQ